MTLEPTGNSSATSPTRYQAGDPCPELVTSSYDWETRQTTHYDPPVPCGGKLQRGWGANELTCRGGVKGATTHSIHQCQHCLGPITTGRYGRPRGDAIYCSTRCRVAAHRARHKAEAAAVTAERSPTRNTARMGKRGRLTSSRG